PLAFSLNDLISDGQPKELVAFFSDETSCAVAIDFTAPEDCSGGTPVCAADLSLTPSPCVEGEYVLAGRITLVDPPTAGTLSVLDGANVLVTFTAPFSSPIDFSLSDLAADGMMETLSLSFSDDMSCTASGSFTAPEDCMDEECSPFALIGDTECNDNGTPFDETDDYISFYLNILGPGRGATYSVTTQSGQPVYLGNGELATNLPYGGRTFFRLGNGSAGDGDDLVVIVDGTTPGCTTAVDLTDPGSCNEDPVCTMIISASPGDCAPGSNTYSLTGSLTFTNAPATGTLTVSVDGAVAQTIDLPFTSPESINITGLNSDGLSHVLRATFSDDPGCTATLDYVAPANCEDAGACTLMATLVTGPCDLASGTYELAGQLTFTDAPAAGTLTVSVGGVTQNFMAPFSSPLNYNLANLTANGSSQTLVASFSDNTGCQITEGFVAPASCDPVNCGVILTADPGDCDPATNTYTLTGEISFTNAPATGTLTVSTAGGSQTFPAPFASPVAYSLDGLVSDGADHAVTASFSDDPLCEASIDFRAPEECDDPDPVCALSVDATPGPCVDGNYDLSGTITFTDAPISGQLVVRDGSTDLLTVNLPTTSPLSFTVPGLPSDSSQHTLTVFFTGDPSCSANDNYMAPGDCAEECEITGRVVSSVCSDNDTPTDLADDSYTITVNATAEDGGASNQFQVLIGVDVQGTFTYGIGGSFDLPADGSSPTLIFQDVDDNSCSDTQDVGPLDNCSTDCLITIDATPGDCDPATGTYDVAGTITFTNVPATGNLRISVDGTPVETIAVAGLSNPQA
ncbi:MAG: hypothetical protein AAGA62_06250, partial [Bacteroidota bacterium]